MVVNLEHFSGSKNGKRCGENNPQQPLSMVMIRENFFQTEKPFTLALDERARC